MTEPGRHRRDAAVDGDRDSLVDYYAELRKQVATREPSDPKRGAPPAGSNVYDRLGPEGMRRPRRVSVKTKSLQLHGEFGEHVSVTTPTAADEVEAALQEMPRVGRREALRLAQKPPPAGLLGAARILPGPARAEYRAWWQSTIEEATTLAERRTLVRSLARGIPGQVVSLWKTHLLAQFQRRRGLAHPGETASGGARTFPGE